MVHSIEFKFNMYITGHRRMNPIHFGEDQMDNFFYRSTKKNYYTLWPMESNFLKFSNTQTTHSIELNLVCIL